MRDEIKRYVESYLSDEAALNDFKKATPKLITDANQKLGQHRQYWKYVLANLSLAIASLGIGYLAAAGVNKALHGHFTFFTVTKSKQLVDTLDQRIALVLPEG